MGKKARRAPGMAADVDVTPLMNLISVLIPALLMTTEFITLAVIDSTLPAIGTPVASDEPPEEKLNLSVAITNSGLSILGASGVLGNPEGEGSTIPCLRDGCGDVDAYDWAKLTEMLGQIKDQFPKEENVILIPDSSIPYEVLIGTMDASREDKNTKVVIDGRGEVAKPLFPYVVIAGGVQ